MLRRRGAKAPKNTEQCTQKDMQHTYYLVMLCVLAALRNQSNAVLVMAWVSFMDITRIIANRLKLLGFVLPVTMNYIGNGEREMKKCERCDEVILTGQVFCVGHELAWRQEQIDMLLERITVLEETIAHLKDDGRADF